MIKVSVSGASDRTKKSLQRLVSRDIYAKLDQYGREGVNALASATPRGETGDTAASWNYHVYHKNGMWGILWTNTHRVNGFPVAIMLQYGHGTGNGGWVQGQNYINPAIRPVMDKIAAEVWKEVKRK